MPDRDWSKELAKVDKQLASLSDEELFGQAGKPQANAPAGKAAAGGKASAAAVAPRGNTGERTTSAFGVYARLLLALALGVAMIVWPYENRCGMGLAGYLAADVAVIVAGVWSAVWTWRHRAARSHVLSLGIVLYGLVLGSLDILPRIGYGKPDLRHPATWTCANVPPLPQPQPTTPPATPPSTTPSTPNGTPPATKPK